MSNESGTGRPANGAVEPFILVIFGASGDLTRRKLVPAVFELFKGGYLPEEFLILGASRSNFSDDQFRDKVLGSNEFIESGPGSDSSRASFSDRLFYERVDTADPDSFGSLKSRLEQLHERFNTCGNMIFYISTPPSQYEAIPENLAAVGLHVQSGGAALRDNGASCWRRLVVEKPFGYDLASAKKLNRSLRRNFDESQIYRIDHYLGKETVQNLLVTRFANGIFEPLWNRNYVHHVQITSAESVDAFPRLVSKDETRPQREQGEGNPQRLQGHVMMRPSFESADSSCTKKASGISAEGLLFSQRAANQHCAANQHYASCASATLLSTPSIDSESFLMTSSTVSVP